MQGKQKHLVHLQVYSLPLKYDGQKSLNNSALLLFGHFHEFTLLIHQMPEVNTNALAVGVIFTKRLHDFHAVFIPLMDIIREK